MRAIAVSSNTNSNSAVLLDSMHRLRARVFGERMKWDVVVKDGREADEFDACRPTYVLALSDTNQVAGCARLLPATGPTLLSVLFPELVDRGRSTRTQR